MQTMYVVVHNAVRELSMPSHTSMVLPGIPWGHFDEVMTPAYWRSQVWQHGLLGTYQSFRLGETLTEEMAACLLGGFGMRAELGLAAFARLRNRGLLKAGVLARELEAELRVPFVLQGRKYQYRFPRQKALYLAGCLARLRDFNEPDRDNEFRDKLALLPGIGLKTASWIVRNHRSSDKVAIIDVHILRAGKQMGLFEAHMEPSKHYRQLEQRFLNFSSAISSAASMLDGLMWDQMRWLSPSFAARR